MVMFVALLRYVWKKKLILFSVSFVSMLLFFAYAAYNTYMTEHMRISLIYPNAEKGYYPDGTRFDMYDMISDTVLLDTIESYNSETNTNHLDLEEVKKRITVDYHLSGNVQDKIQSAINLGQNYTYFSNEYIISFNPKTIIGLEPFVDTKLFMEKLYDSYSRYFMNSHTEMNIISKITQNISGEDYDYMELADMYGKKITMYVNYLSSKSQEDQAFRSQTTGISFNDLVSSFTSLYDVKLKNLVSFISSGRVTKNVEDVLNNYRTRIETSTLKYSLYQDESDIAATAMRQYDHTFDANIVIVGVNEELGLYQSRPRTAFDQVTKRSLEAGKNAKNTLNDILEYERLINEYSNVEIDEEERTRLISITESMFEDLTRIYNSLVEQANKTVDDYLLYKCSNFINSASIPKNYTNTYVMAKSIMVFCSVAFILFLILLLSDKDSPLFSMRRRLKKKSIKSDKAALL